MEYVSVNYNDEEQAWVSQEITLHRDIYLMITLKVPGKIVIRQDAGDGKTPRVPISPHKNMKGFNLRIRVVAETVKIKIFTSTEPMEIKYAYI